jgi:hypothetical protein
VLTQRNTQALELANRLTPVIAVEICLHQGSMRFFVGLIQVENGLPVPRPFEKGGVASPRLRARFRHPCLVAVGWKDISRVQSRNSSTPFWVLGYQRFPSFPVEEIEVDLNGGVRPKRK